METDYMKKNIFRNCFGMFLLFVSVTVQGQTLFYNIKTFGAKGDGVSLDTKAINDAIDAAANAGGGTVYFPAGTYLSFSIHLKSHISIFLDAGSVLLAADSIKDKGRYDEAEPNKFDQYEDYGHSHWHNSLIWGENLIGYFNSWSWNYQWKRIEPECNRTKARRQ